MVLCKKCNSDNVHKNGIKTIKGEKRQVWKCKSCNHKFHTDHKEIDFGKFEEYSKEEHTENALYLEAVLAGVHTIEDLIAYHKLDMNEWELEKKLVLNAWGNYNNSNRQVKGWFTKKDKSKITIPELCDLFKKNVLKHTPKIIKPNYQKKKDSQLLEIGPVDQHLAQLSWGKETGADYDIDIARKIYNDSVQYLGSQADSIYNIDRILFVAGHDFFNSDNMDHATTKGTSQDEDSRWQKSFDIGCSTVVEAIDFLKQIAPVDVKVVLGNHDKQKSYYMGAYLEAWYKNNKNVSIDNSPVIRKYYEYGVNLIGLAHMGKDERLAFLMPLEAKEAWGRTKYHEIHKGHVHHESKKMILLDTEMPGIKIRTFNTLTALDAWHKEMGFDSQRQSQSMIWDKKLGPLAEFKYTL